MERTNQQAVRIAAALAMAAVLWQSYRFVPQAFSTLAELALLAGLLGVVCLAFLGWGAVALRLLGSGGGLQPAAAWAAGAAASATLAGWLAPLWFPDLRLWVAWLGGGVLLAWGQRHRFEWRGALPTDRLLLLIAPFLLAAGVLALAPPLSLDSLVYHLALPRQFALAGRAVPMPWNVTASLPLHAEMLYGLCLALDASGRLAQLLHLAAAVVTLTAVIELGGRHLGRLAGVWAAILLYTLPVLTLISGWAWSDWFVLLYATLALDRLLTLRRSGHPPAARELMFFLGGAAAVKYNALPLLALPALVLPRLRPRDLVAGGLLVAALVGPWYGRNLLATGNPVYPLLSAADNLEHLVDFRGAESGAQKWLGYLGRPDLLDESLGALLAAALVLAVVFTVRRWRQVWPLVFVAAIYLVVAAVRHPTVRTFTPLLLAAALLAGGGVAELWGRGRRAWIAAAAALLLWVNFTQTLWVVRKHRPSGVALGYERVETYLGRELDLFTACRWINRNTAADAGVLVVGDSRIFHLERLAIAGSYLDPHPLRGFLRPNEGLPALVERLRAAGVELILFNTPRYVVGDSRELRDELVYYADPATDRVFQALIARHTEPLFAEHEVAVLRLVDRPEGDP